MQPLGSHLIFITRAFPSALIMNRYPGTYAALIREIFLITNFLYFLFFKCKEKKKFYYKKSQHFSDNRFSILVKIISKIYLVKANPIPGFLLSSERNTEKIPNQSGILSSVKTLAQLVLAEILR